MLFHLPVNAYFDHLKAHFSGALLGVAYSQFDGKNNVWKPLVRFWKRQLQT